MEEKNICPESDRSTPQIKFQQFEMLKQYQLQQLTAFLDMRSKKSPEHWYISGQGPAEDCSLESFRWILRPGGQQQRRQDFSSEPKLHTKVMTFFFVITIAQQQQLPLFPGSDLSCGELRSSFHPRPWIRPAPAVHGQQTDASGESFWGDTEETEFLLPGVENGGQGGGKPIKVVAYCTSVHIGVETLISMS